MPAPPPLPANCAGCAYSRAALPKGLLCIRHAPSPTSEPVHVSATFDVAEWPHVRPQDRCGAGASSSAANAPVIVSCESCIHWFQPGGVGVKPDFTGMRPAGWWAESGFCTRFSPSPSVEDGMHAQWRITHKTSACGDCEAVEQDQAEEGMVQEPQPVARLS